ncbi:uncharacterized protein LOC123214102 [Mangifera indica]|uniref:uncharacterized protein LOC123214102 n=1 Tax=Mangifera indica TaxID=29780 RepID=UPI001CFA04BD|nr:uncharacterized protein LOC123214102 [Mangifera indica]
MAAESSKTTGFGLNYSTCNSEGIPNPNSNLMSMGFGMGMGNYFASSSGFIPGLVQPPNSCSTSTFLDSSGLKHDTGFAVDWSMHEQLKLEEGLIKYSDEPNIMRYVKIAATLRDKTVRDVALRCRWMTRKRRKPEEYNFGKKVISRKDKLVELNLKTNIPLTYSQNMGSYPFLMHQMDQNGPFPFEVLGISGTTRHLLEQNSQAFSQITANLSTFKLQDNVELFCHTRNNIIAILNDMRDMPGIMSQMPPLPVSINEDLANSILPHTTQSMMFGSPMGIQLKQEPRC